MEMKEEEALVPLMRNRKTKLNKESTIRVNQSFKYNESSRSSKITEKILRKFGVHNYKERKKLYFVIGSEVDNNLSIKNYNTIQLLTF